MESNFEHIEDKFQNLVGSSFLCFNDVSSKKNVMGVYVIYEKDNTLLYVGSTNKFHVRFGTDLKYESTHTLMRKLLKTGKFLQKKDVVDFLTNQCKIKVEVCDSKREAEALESMVIYILNPIYNK